MKLSRLDAISLSFLLSACGATQGSTEPVPEPEAATEPIASSEPTGGSEEPAVTTPSPTAPQAAPSLTSLRSTIEAVEPVVPVVPARALSRCPAPSNASQDALLAFHEECAIPSLVARDGDAWLVLRTESSEGGIEEVLLARARPGIADEVVLAEHLEPATLARIRRGLARVRRAAPSIVIGRAAAEFSMSTYTPLVALGAPLEGAQLFLETTIDLDHPEHVLHLVAEDGTARELARDAARLVACDGGGWTCGDEGEEDCEADDLRAEGRLCVEPWSIDSVHVEGDQLLLVGTVVVAGDGGYPSFHWAVRHTPSE